MKVNFLSETPPHKQVYLKMVDDILRGIYNTDIRLPSVKELSEEYAVSAMTIERAYRQLLKEDLVSYIKGAGYFVTSEKVKKIRVSSLTKGRNIKNEEPIVIC
ncbi:winged helix-turn-helix domain-containing protein [Pedobacter sp. P351]|uniref:winged helix-turn-helix domain-containing protein n=1 Tax=Pedobacter superstes TaxID=3133441 RepID=UPI0030AD5064